MEQEYKETALPENNLERVEFRGKSVFFFVAFGGTMERANFSYLIGAERGGIRWGRPMMFFAALFFSDIVTRLLFAIFKTFIEPKLFTLFNIFIEPKKDDTLNISYLPNPLYVASDNIINNLILAFLLVLVFYLIKNELIATIVAVVLYPAFSLVVNFITYKILWFTISGILFESPGEGKFLWMRTLFISAIYVIFVIGGMVVAAFFKKLTWLLLPLGALVGSIAYTLSLEGFSYLSLDKYEFKPLDAIPFLISSVILGFVFWLGIWITADKPSLPEGEKPRLSKEFYAGTWASTVLVGSISIIFIILSMYYDIMYYGSLPKTKIIGAVILLLIALLLIIYGAVVFMILIYKMWAAIQDGYARTTPGKAVGFLFIPIYSLYWMFQVLPGFAQDYNEYIARYNLNIKHLPTGLFTAYCVLILLSVIPILGIILSLANFFVGIAMMSKACDAVNALPTAIGGSNSPNILSIA